MSDTNSLDRALKQGHRRSLSAGDLSDVDLATIARAEVPAAECYRLKDIGPKRKR